MEFLQPLNLKDAWHTSFSGSTSSPGSLMWPPGPFQFSLHLCLRGHSTCSHSNSEWPVGSVLSPYTPSAPSNLCFCSEGSCQCCLTIMAHVTYFPPPGSLLWCCWLGKVAPLHILPSQITFLFPPVASTLLVSIVFTAWLTENYHYNKWALCSMPNGSLSVPVLISVARISSFHFQNYCNSWSMYYVPLRIATYFTISKLGLSIIQLFERKTVAYTSLYPNNFNLISNPCGAC